MSYRVVAPLVLVRVPAPVGDDYRVDYHYAGSHIPWLSEKQHEQFLAEGLVVELDESEGTPAPDDGRPKKTASQADWATFAVTQGANAEEAAQLSRQELIELYGG